MSDGDGLQGEELNVQEKPGGGIWNPPSPNAQILNLLETRKNEGLNKRLVHTMQSSVY
jgi:hypothetical protein